MIAALGARAVQGHFQRRTDLLRRTDRRRFDFKKLDLQGQQRHGSIQRQSDAAVVASSSKSAVGQS